MGSKVGYVSNREGDRICVSFAGSGVADSDLCIEGVTVQMNGGGGEYAPVKYATATIDVLADGLQHADLLTTRGVEVSVTNETSGTVLFAGWVSPNNYNVSVTGINDTFTVECVDRLGYAKFIPYPLADPYGGPMALSIAAVVARVCDFIGAQGMYMSAALRIVSGELATSRYDLMTVLESYFMNSASPRVISGQALYEPVMLSCYDVLKMIAESLRMSFIQEGNAVYLHDYMQGIDAGKAEFFDATEAGIPKEFWKGVVRKVEEDTLDGTVQVSALPRYSLVSLERGSAGEVIVMPNVVNEEYMTLEGDISSDGDKMRWCELKHMCYETGYKEGNVQLSSSKFVAYKEVESSATAVYWPDGGWTTALRIYSNGGATRTPIFKGKVPFLMPVQGRDILCLVLRWGVQFSSDKDAMYPKDSVSLSAAKVYCYLKIGELYYNATSGEWQTDRHMMELETKAEKGAWSETVINVDRFKIDWSKPTSRGIAPITGQVELALYDGTGDWKVAYFNKLELAVVPNPIGSAVEHWIPKSEQIGGWAYLEEAEPVRLPIEHNSVLAEKFYGTQINGVEFFRSAGKYGLEFQYGNSVTVTRRSMIEHINAQANIGDGMEYVMTLVDENNGTLPTDVFISDLWAGNKVVAGYERDIVNSSITVTLN